MIAEALLALVVAAFVVIVEVEAALVVVLTSVIVEAEMASRRTIRRPWLWWRSSGRVVFRGGHGVDDS